MKFVLLFAIAGTAASVLCCFVFAPEGSTPLLVIGTFLCTEALDSLKLTDQLKPKGLILGIFVTFGPLTYTCLDAGSQYACYTRLRRSSRPSS